MHAQFFDQFALAGDAVQIADQQNTEQQFGADGRPSSIAVTLLGPLANKPVVDVLVDRMAEAINVSVSAHAGSESGRGVPYVERMLLKTGKQCPREGVWRLL
jgi:hypothetical protein